MSVLITRAIHNAFLKRGLAFFVGEQVEAHPHPAILFPQKLFYSD
ncbi:putative co/Zn/Cd efflux system [Acinetobacter baumannii]|nr:putative co/Zn/Cd efflux system [Acinetobacter baumannii]